MKIDSGNTKEEMLAEAGRRMHAALDAEEFQLIFNLEAHQSEMLRKLADMWLNGKTADGGLLNYLIVSAPGTGKTRMMLAIAYALNTKTLFKAPTRAAIDRIVEEVGKIGLADNQIGQYHADSKDYNQLYTLITNVSQVLGFARREIIPDAFGLIFSDEAHHQLSEGQIDINKHFSNAIHVGFTATPTYSAEKTLRDHWLVAAELPYPEALARKAAAPIDNYIFFTKGSDISNVKTQNGATGRDFNLKKMEEALDKPERYQQLAEMIDHWVNKKTGRKMTDDPSMIFCSTINEAERVAAYLNVYFEDRFPESNLTSFAVTSHSDNTKDENKANDIAFRAHQHKILIAVSALAESYDWDKITTIANWNPTISTLFGTQRGCRAGRLDRENVNKHAAVIDIFDRDKTVRALTFYQCVYGDSYFKFADIPDSLKYSLYMNAIKAVWKEQDEQNIGPKVVSVDEMITEHAAKAAAEEKKRIRDLEIQQEELRQEQLRSAIEGQRKVIIDDPIFPFIRERMYEKGFLTVRKLYEVAAQYFAQNKHSYNFLELVPGEKNRDLSYSRLIFVLSKDLHGLGQLYTKKHVYPELLMISQFLDIDLNARFSDNPHDRKNWRATNDAAEASVAPAEEKERYEREAEKSKIMADIEIAEKHTFKDNPILPGLKAELDKLGLHNFTDIFRAAQMEFGKKHLSPRDMAYTLTGRNGVLNSKRGWKKLFHLTPEAVALCLLVQKQPGTLFAEQQYFDLLQTYIERDKRAIETGELKYYMMFENADGSVADCMSAEGDSSLVIHNTHQPRTYTRYENAPIAEKGKLDKQQEPIVAEDPPRWMRMLRWREKMAAPKTENIEFEDLIINYEDETGDNASDYLINLQRKVGLPKNFGLRGNYNRLDAPKTRILFDLLIPEVRESMCLKGIVSVREIYAYAPLAYGHVDYHKMLLLCLERNRSTVIYNPETFKTEIRILKDILGIDLSKRYKPGEVMFDRVECPDESLTIDKDLAERGNFKAELDSFYTGDDNNRIFDRIQCFPPIEGGPIDAVLPKIREKMTKLGLESFEDLFALTTMECPLKEMDPEEFFELITGFRSIIDLTLQWDESMLGALSNEAVALCCLFDMNPVELFAEEQYLELAERMNSYNLKVARVLHSRNGEQELDINEWRATGLCLTDKFDPRRHLPFEGVQHPPVWLTSSLEHVREKTYAEMAAMGAFKASHK